MTQIRTLLTGMATNSFKRLSLSTEEASFANLLPRTRANFDGGSTWASDAALVFSPTGGVGSGTTQASEWAFSGAAISEIDGKCTFQGGGHTDSGDGSVYTFDCQAAAENINLGGSGIAWAMALASARYIDAFSNARPSAINSPAGAQEGAPTTPTATNQAYWLWPNAGGVAMPGSGHTYHCNKYIPGTRKVLISQWGSMDGNQGCSCNAGYVFDDSDNSMAGPLITSAGMPANGGTTLFGYAQIDSGITCVAVNDLDGLPYSGTLQNFNFRIYKWTSPTTSSLALVDTGITMGGTDPSWETADALICPQPWDTTKRMFFIHGSPLAFGDTKFQVVTDLNGTPTANSQTYGTGAITSNGGQYLHYAYRKGVIWMTDGNHLFTITPSQTLTAWTIAQITGFTGDVPPDPTLIGTSIIPALNYIPSQDCFIHVQKAGVRIYKPTDWNPPPDIVPAQPYQPWYQLGPFLAQ